MRVFRKIYQNMSSNLFHTRTRSRYWYCSHYVKQFYAFLLKFLSKKRFNSKNVCSASSILITETSCSYLTPLRRFPLFVVVVWAFPVILSCFISLLLLILKAILTTFSDCFIFDLEGFFAPDMVIQCQHIYLYISGCEFK